MTLKSIAIMLHDPKADLTALEYAIKSAREWGAHLHIVVAGINHVDPDFYYAGMQYVAMRSNFENAASDATKLEETVRERLRVEDINWDVQSVTMLAGSLGSYVSNHLRFFDIMIMPLPYEQDRSQIDVTIFESCIFGAGIPTIVVPKGFAGNPPHDHILIAWDEGAEALAAARAARPLASAVRLTEVCIIAPSIDGNERSDPGGELARYLARYDAKVKVTVSAKLKSDVATQLIKNADEAGADLIVMGAYGRSRLREAVLGGVTRTMLRHATVPVLLAH